MTRHFATRKEANTFLKSKSDSSLKVWKKKKGHRNSKNKPFVVCSEFRWLNLD